ncbi:MAG TPA: translocation/assembly module TamB domain-containing protein [Candidatus Eisenbacteria bacterium]|nr:translocation/assembly module TamB domain-containing protein [Candidatus Eisenbacteria bacterium]
MLWLLGGLATLIAVLVAGAWVYTQTDDFRTRLESLAVAAIEDSVNGEVKIERISGSIWRQLDFHNLSIRQHGAEVIAIPRLSLAFGLIRQAVSFLFSSSLHVSRLEIEAPAVALAQDANGAWNVAALFERPDTPGEPRPLDIFLDRIVVTNGRFDARLASGDTVHVRSLYARANVALLAAATRLEVTELSYEAASEKFPPTRWSGALSSRISDSDSTLDIRTLDVRSPASEFRISGRVRNLADPSLSITLELPKVAAAEVVKLLPEVPLREDFSGVISVTGPLSALRAAGTIRFADGTLSPSIVSDLTGAEAQFHGTVEAHNFVIEKVLDIADAAGRLNGKLSFKGASFRNAEASAQASISGLTVRQWRLGDMKLTAHLVREKLAFEANVAAGAGQAIMKARAVLSEPISYEANLAVDKLDIQNTAQAISASLPVTGEISLQAFFKGRGTDPRRVAGSGKISILPSRIGPVEELRGAIAGTLNEGVLALDEAKLESRGTTLLAQGKLALFADTPTGKLNYRVSAREIAPWAALAGVDAKGSVNGTGIVGGSLDKLSLRGTATLSAIELPAVSFQQGAASWNFSGIGGAGLRGTIKTTMREVEAGIRLRSVETDLAVNGMKPMHMQARFAAQDRENRTHTLRGRASYTSEAADILLERVALQTSVGTWRNAGPAALHLKDKRLAIEALQLQNGAQGLRVDGVAALEGAQDLRVRLARFPIEALRAFLESDPGLAGELSAELTVGGTAVRPVLQSELSIERPSIAGQAYQGLTGDVSYRDERLSVDLVLRQDASRFLTAKGGIPIYLGWGGEKSVSVTGEADLRIYSGGLSAGFLGVVSDQLEDVRGNLLIDLRLRGPVTNLRPSGAIELQDSQARVKPLAITVTGINVQARVAPEGIQLTRISARSGEGHLTGNGKIGLHGYSIGTIDIGLRAENFRVINTAEYTVGVSGRLTGTGSHERQFISGTLTLAETRLRPNLAALRQTGPPPRDPTIVVVKNERELARLKEEPGREKAAVSKGENARAGNGFYQQLGMRITLIVPRGTWVYLDDGAVDLMGQLQIVKDPEAEVSLAGTLESVRGWYTFQGKRFQLEKARLQFTGGEMIDPSLDVVARHKLPDYQIDLVLGGTARKPTLTLRSEPAMEQADILSTLLFGKPVGRLSEGQQVSLQAQALRTSANFVASGLRQSVAKRLGVDNLEFGFGEKTGEPRVGVGKYITQDIYVSGAQELGNEAQQEYSLEYNISPNWQVKGSTTPQGQSGIDLFWRRQY